MSDLRNAIKLALCATGAAGSALGSQSAYAQDDALEEITVTATRREQSITDVPYNISAVTGETIANAGVTNMADLMRQVPGVTFLDTGPRGNSVSSPIVLRGVNLNSTASGAAVPNTAVPAVSTYLNDTPTFVNLKLLDINRVEVLRGPQGTLYGSGSLAGTVRFIFNDPDYENVTFSANASVESLGESDDNSYSIEAVANFPIGDNAAFRIAAAYEDIGGVVDAQNIYVTDANGQPVLVDPADTFFSPGVTTSIDDYDTGEMAAFRATFKSDLSDNVGLAISWHHQDLESVGDNFRDQGSEEYVFTQNARVNTMDLTADAIALEVEADLGFATLTSSTSYANVDYDSRRDLTYLALFLDTIDAPEVGITPCFFYGCYPRQLLDASEPAQRKDTTQEFRLVSNTEGKVDWIAGLYYNENEADNTQVDISQGYAEWASDQAWIDFDIFGGLTLAQLLPYYGVSDPTTVDSQFFQHRQADFTDAALFGEVTYHISDAWQITAGARYYSQEYDLAFYQEFSNCGAFCSQDEMNPLGLVDLRSKTDDNDILWKFNTSVDLGDAANAYFNFSQGFRRGGANGAFVSSLLGIPESALTYDADSGDNYEVGIKGTIAGSTRYSLAYFILDWKNAQIDDFEPNTGIQIVTNLAEARTQGLEAELNGSIGDNFIYSLGYNYTRAEVSKTDQPYPFPVPIEKGTTLPGTAKNQFNAAGDYYIPLANNIQVRLHADAFYRSSTPNALLATSGEDLPSFTLVNASVSLESDNGWSVGLFGRNVFDERNAFFARGRPDFGYLFDAASRPRSYGIRASWRFE